MEKSSQNNPSFGQGLELAGIIIKALASAAKETKADLDKVQSVIGKPGVLYDVFRNLLAESVEVKPAILRLLSDGQSLSLNALNGQRLIYNSKKTFPSFIDDDFKHWNLNKKGVATPKTIIEVHQIMQDSTFMEIFSALPGTWNQKWLSQNQIIEFCEELSNCLSTTGVTISLVKKDENKPVDEAKPQDNLVVVYVRVNSDGLYVDVISLEYGRRWDAEYLCRVVSPQLISLAE